MLRKIYEERKAKLEAKKNLSGVQLVADKPPEEDSSIKKVSDVTAMVVDTCLGVEFARVLGRKYKKVYYCNPSWVSVCPMINDYLVGQGFDEIEVCFSPFEHFKDVDAFIFPYLGNAIMQEELVKMGKKVWGSRVKGENLESKRFETHELFKSLGLPVGKYEEITGTTALRKFLKANKDQAVKIDIFRATQETFVSYNYDYSESVLDRLELNLGAYKEKMKFLVEELLKDKIEGGTDTICIDGQFAKTCIYGVEVKNECYAGVMTEWDKIPDFMKMDAVKLSSIMKDCNYRNFFSTEIKIGKDHVPYTIDLTVRWPHPPGGIYEVMYSNLPEIVWYGANGKVVDPKPIDKWAVEILLRSDWALDNWQELKAAKEFDENLKIDCSVRIDGKRYRVPHTDKSGCDIMAAIIAHGSTLDDAMKMADEIGKTVEGYHVVVPTDSLEKAKKVIETSKEYGTWLKE